MVHRALLGLLVLLLAAHCTNEGQIRTPKRDAGGSAMFDGGHDLAPTADAVTPRSDGAPRDTGAADAPVTTTDQGAPKPDSGGIDLCKGVTCSGHGTCKVEGAQAVCECEAYYKPDGLACVPACTGIKCAEGKACIPGHHGQTDPLCVDTCDCGNCGNCGAGDIPSFGVSYCGSTSAPASVVCTKPCPGGQGCIPFATPICWGGQGCISK